MPSRTVTNEDQRAALIAFIGQFDLPFTINIAKGKKRSTWQNQLQRLWINEIAAQREDVMPELVRGEIKLTLGVPILRAEDEVFCDQYDTHIKPLPYETKLAMMMEPLDFPVTRIMTTKQHKQLLDDMWHHFTGAGFILTDPEMQRLGETG